MGQPNSKGLAFWSVGSFVVTETLFNILESSEVAPQTDAVTSSAPIVPTNDIPLFPSSTRVSQQPERYGFLGLTGQLDNDPKTYGEAMLDIDSKKWTETIKFEMDSMSSIKMDVKMTFLNGFVEEEIYMDQSEGFISIGEEHKKKVSGSSVVFLMLYVDDILLIGNDVNFSRRQHTVCCVVHKVRFRFRFERNEQISGFVFKLNGGVVAWKGSKQDITADSSTDAEYIAALEAAKETICMKNYMQELGVVPSVAEPVVIFCDKNRAIA
ncbi:UNVERIFIED_CONTAM: hypothetical protein Scaly_3109400 [Sesamum calycinum]|uniref:Reverse transcriptase Ty1/copia-type domain-containing protein n=1 Tax=Sesamum calycinum TaxID=2727403 RepID=A0AAW2JL30_9LAMI